MKKTSSSNNHSFLTNVNIITSVWHRAGLPSLHLHWEYSDSDDQPRADPGKVTMCPSPGSLPSSSAESSSTAEISAIKDIYNDDKDTFQPIRGSSQLVLLPPLSSKHSEAGPGFFGLRVTTRCSITTTVMMSRFPRNTTDLVLFFSISSSPQDISATPLKTVCNLQW